MFEGSDSPVSSDQLPSWLREESDVLNAVLGIDAPFFQSLGSNGEYHVTVSLPLSSGQSLGSQDEFLASLTVIFNGSESVPQILVESLDSRRFPRDSVDECQHQLETEMEALWSNEIRPLLSSLIMEAEQRVGALARLPSDPQPAITVTSDDIRYNFVTTEPYTIHRSKFQVFSTPFTGGEEEKKKAVSDLLLQHRACQQATHNMAVWRVQGKNGVESGSDEDGEHGAGNVLAYLLEKMNVIDRLVVVSRWFGGVLLGPARFKVISDVARDHLLQQGIGCSNKSSGGKSNNKRGK